MKKIPLIVSVGFFLLLLFIAFAPLLAVKMRAYHFLGALQEDACRVELTPRKIPGNFWEKHRYYLEAPIIYRGSPFYIIQDSRTQAVYYWSRWDDHEGRTRFSVLTRFAMFYPDWESSRWILLYKC